jgi:hypothetical protein
VRLFFLARCAIVAAAFTPSGAHAADDTPSGVELGLRIGYALPVGSIELGGPALHDIFSGVLPIWIDAGYRLSPHWLFGAYFQYGVGFLQDFRFCSFASTGCDGSDVTFGAQVHYHVLPTRSFDPWVGAGVGYEILNYELGRDFTRQGFNGVQFFVGQAGLDFKGTPKWGIGPMIATSVGMFSSCSQYYPGDCSIGGPSLSLHAWVTLGLRGAYDIDIR